MIPRYFLPLWGAALALAFPSAAAAAQLDAKEAPTVKGPLDTSPGLKGCKKQSENNGGQVIARFKVCSRYYEFDPDHENDSDSNYGAFWIQANVDATNGWCVRSAQVKLSYGGGVRNKAPKPGMTERAKHRERFKTKLIVDTDGHSTGSGTVKNSFALLPGKLRARITGGGDYKLAWKGRTVNKLALAAGLELSWPESGQAPAISPKVSAVLDRNCN